MFDYKNATDRDLEKRFKEMGAKYGQGGASVPADRRALQNSLDPSEDILCWIEGRFPYLDIAVATYNQLDYDYIPSLIALTDQRIIAVCGAFTIRNRSLDLKAIDEARVMGGMFSSVVSLQWNGISKMIRGVSKKPAAHFCDAVKTVADAKKKRLGESKSRPAPVSLALASDDSLARLDRLGALREKGILTEAEFQEQKRKLLDSM